MKVLMVNKYFYPRGGSEQVFFQERAYLANRGIAIVDFSMQHESNVPSLYSNYFVRNEDYGNRPKPLLLGGLIDTVKRGLKFIHNGEAVSKIGALVEREKPDLAHLHNIYHQLTPSIISALKRYGVKVIITLHDYKLICPIYLMLRQGHVCDKCQGKRFWNVITNKCHKQGVSHCILLAIEAYWHYFKRSYYNVDRILCPSAFLKDKLVSLGTGFPDISVLHNGVDLNKYEFSGVDDGYVLYVGRISQEKGLHVLVEAYDRMCRSMGSKGEQQRLIVAGTGEGLEQLRARHAGVVFCGYKTGEELRGLLASCSFVVVPSVWHENFSMTVLEAMASGKAVIGSRMGGIPEQIVDGHTGFLVAAGSVEELESRMTQLVVDRELCTRMGEAGRRRVELEFSLSRHGQRLIEIYEEELMRSR